MGRSRDEISNCHAGGAHLRIVRRRVVKHFFDRTVSIIISRCRFTDGVDTGFGSVRRLNVGGNIDFHLVLFFGHNLRHPAGVLVAFPVLELTAL